jgi:uncharacterized protein (TIGR03382 family)
VPDGGGSLPDGGGAMADAGTGPDAGTFEDGGVEPLGPGQNEVGGGCGCSSGSELSPLLGLGLLLVWQRGRRRRA